ncbi:WxL domain-containing protein [Vagococcus lutrae]|uniref:WxL domain-containing protein n=1 Tax=Vagococcus lutrae TaxID=81947 RepID=UPI00288E3F8A|nr:WxL domain-containing protein [Vagococcus lutrae]MDT2802030.1 WxL domain-containing protein [Vagococcus lutrae]MDT2826220.1 WxL domain-containing protein [Vagococcus lutrae]MDT2842115.1 WxL domain-containing protein [Vagococcus lutrae]
MKYNKIISLASVMALGLSMGAGVVSAAGQDGGEYTSNGLIEFTPGEQPVDPVDPLNPEQPVDPTDPTDPEGKPQPGTPGPLSIDFASSFNFGDNKITSKDEIYYAGLQKYKDKDTDQELREGPNYVQVTDNRGTLAGWTLKVKQTKQFETDDSHKLDGAKITLINGNINTVSESAPATAVDKIEIDNMNEDLLVMSAKKDAGAGTFLTRWGDEDLAKSKESVKLFVPGKAVKKKAQYRTSFVWTLTDVPGN